MPRLMFCATLVLLAAGEPVRAQSPTTGLVNVRVPRDARLHVDDVFCPLPGELRSFETPPIDPKRKYYYTLRVEITVEGKPVRVSRRAIVEAGRVTEIDFGDREAIIAAAILPKEIDDRPGKEKNPKPEYKDPKNEDRPIVKDNSPATPPGKVPPGHALATIKGDALLLIKLLTRTDWVEEERLTVVDGQPKKIKVKVPKFSLDQKTTEFKLKEIKAFDTAGKDIGPGKLSDLLDKPTAVLLATESQLDPFYLRTIKEGTIILVTPEQVTIGKGSSDPPEPPINPPQPSNLPRVSGLPPLLVKATYKDGFIIWKEIVTVSKPVSVTEKKLDKDGKEVEVEVTKVKFEQKEIEQRVEATKAKLATVGGKTVEVDELDRRLAMPTAVLVSVDGLPIDPFHLQLFDDDTLTIVAKLTRPAPPDDKKDPPREEKKDPPAEEKKDPPPEDKKGEKQS